MSSNKKLYLGVEKQLHWCIKTTPGKLRPMLVPSFIFRSVIRSTRSRGFKRFCRGKVMSFLSVTDQSFFDPFDSTAFFRIEKSQRMHSAHPCEPPKISSVASVKNLRVIITSMVVFILNLLPWTAKSLIIR